MVYIEDESKVRAYDVRISFINRAKIKQCRRTLAKNKKFVDKGTICFSASNNKFREELWQKIRNLRKDNYYSYTIIYEENWERSSDECCCYHEVEVYFKHNLFLAIEQILNKNNVDNNTLREIIRYLQLCDGAKNTFKDIAPITIEQFYAQKIYDCLKFDLIKSIYKNPDQICDEYTKIVIDTAIDIRQMPKHKSFTRNKLK